MVLPVDETFARPQRLGAHAVRQTLPIGQERDHQAAEILSSDIESIKIRGFGDVASGRRKRPSIQRKFSYNCAAGDPMAALAREAINEYAGRDVRADSSLFNFT